MATQVMTSDIMNADKIYKSLSQVRLELSQELRVSLADLHLQHELLQGERQHCLQSPQTAELLNEQDRLPSPQH